MLFLMNGAGIIMIFETLNASNERGELLLVDGGMCHWHLRRDKQLTIREILVQKNLQGQGIGTDMLRILRQVPEAESVFAKCPADLRANDWYLSRGFVLEETEFTKSGRAVNHWRLDLV